MKIRTSLVLVVALVTVSCFFALTTAVRLRTQSDLAESILEKSSTTEAELDEAWNVITSAPVAKKHQKQSKEKEGEKKEKESLYHVGQMKYGDCVADRNNKIAPAKPSAGLNECHPYENLACCGAEDAMDAVKIVRDRAVGLFGHCPTCYNGFLSLFCGAQCSPTQDSFLTIHKRAKRKIDNLVTLKVCSSFCAKLYLSCGGVEIGGKPMREMFKSAEEFCMAHIPTIGAPFHSELGPGQNSTMIVALNDDDNCFDAQMSTDCDADHPFDPSGGGRIQETEKQKEEAAAMALKH